MKHIYIVISMMVVILTASFAQGLVGQKAFAQDSDGQEEVSQETTPQETIETDEDLLFGEPVETINEEEINIKSEEEDLFGEGDLIADLEEKEEDMSTLLLSTEGVEIGGKYRFEASSSWSYDGAQGPFGANLTDDSLLLDLGVQVFMDARPFDDFRVFGKVDVSFPFTNEDGTRNFDDVFHVNELFSDFQAGDTLFFRAGKQTINWGVGYFFSPADLLNITEIDPEDPEAELEGPVSLKLHAPIGAHNLYLYTVFQDADSAGEIALAPKAEFVIGDTEIGAGLYYRSTNAPAVMTTLTTSVLDFDIFAEGVISYGSNRTFAVKDSAAPLGVSTKKYNDLFFPSATVGLTYSFSDDFNYFDLAFSAQYMYNGEGYSDPDFLKNNEAGVIGLLAAGDLSASDLIYTGRHYAAVNGTWTEMFGSDFNLACLWLGNLSDGSGMVTPSVTWNVIEYLDIVAKVGFMYGEKGDEYTPAGDAMALTLAATLGGGSF
jgi:hypothetical protein